MSKARNHSVEIQFGGKTRHLIADFNARAELQDALCARKSNAAHLKAVRAALWALLLAETLDDRGRETEKTLSIVEVGNILDEMMQDDPAVLPRLSAATREAFGVSEVPDEDRPTIATPTPQA